MTAAPQKPSAAPSGEVSKSQSRTPLDSSLFAFISESLQEIYEFETSLSAEDFIVGDEYIQKLRQAEVISHSSSNRGQLIIVPQGSDEVDIAIYLADHIRSQLQRNSPLQELSNQNLDAFCVVVEEISHFQLFAHKAQRGLKISQIEMEWQAEIDKFLLCTRLLQQQTNNAHFVPIARALFDQAIISAGMHQQRYLLANQVAAALCFRMIDQAPQSIHCPVFCDFREFLRNLYPKSWSEKSNSDDHYISLKAA